MRPLLSFISLFSFIQPLSSQEKVVAETEFPFNKRFSECENRWVAFPKSEKDNKYPFGFVYIDAQAGFTFDMEGTFSLINGKMVRDSFEKKGSFKYRLQTNTKKVTELSAEHLAILRVDSIPDWLTIYAAYTDTIRRLIRWGYHYNHVNECHTALTFLEKAYKQKPHAEGLEFELSFAYNALGRYNEAINVLGPAIKNDPKNMLLIRELGYSYLEKKDYSRAIAIYKEGIEKCSDDELATKSEMAVNMASAYKAAGNEEQYKIWGTKAKEWAPKDSPIYNHLIKLGF
ncbi:MAG TPA: tetratricopeptide repeat protein [Chitinophagaceae bacterium]|nr:tetratricopeptide repeat protein [Chitinophagaceae bacterium]HNU13620.1 tetratricopeptide repeat protein [Chitinophagaceae bacterium]